MIYFDQASSSFPKAPPVPDAVRDFLAKGATNISRGGVNAAFDANQLVYRLRRDLLAEFGAEDKMLTFCPNVTTALNYLIKGYFKAGDHLLITGLEHNAVMRPLEQMKSQGVSYSVIPCDAAGRLNLDLVETLIRPETKAILSTSASNVCGTIMPLAELAQIAQARHLEFFVDGAQLAGYQRIDVKRLGITALGLTGHKSLLGPQGIGALILSEELGEQMEPILAGGTGSLSNSFEMPRMLPDRFEAGTQNLPGIAGLLASLDWLKENGSEASQHEFELAVKFIRGLEALNLKVVGLGSAESTPERRVPLVSLDLPDGDVALLSAFLETEYEILTRVGLHCAPLAHQSLGTYPRGTIRFSFGYSQTEAEVDLALEAIAEYLSFA